MTIIKEYWPKVKQMTYSCFESENHNWFGMTTEQLNDAILEDFYKAVGYVISMKFEYIQEIVSRTINPAQQNAFLPLREYRVKRNGHYKTIKIYTKMFGGFCIVEEQ